MKEPLAPVYELIDKAVSSGQLRSAVLQVRSGKTMHLRAFGQARTGTVFLLASITKPMTAAAVMSLVEAGRLSLDEPAQKYVPELAGADRARITVRSLLDHTSGLPDMPPDNQELRRRHAPLADFLTSACRAPLLFPPGTAVRYQSMGFLVAATIVERLTGQPLREHLRRSLFAPLKMEDTSLGLGGRSYQPPNAPTVAAGDPEGKPAGAGAGERRSAKSPSPPHPARQTDFASCQVPDDPGGWNSPYWRDLGSPWGGAHGTAADLIRLLDFFGRPAAGASTPAPSSLLRPESILAMLTPSLPTASQSAGGPPGRPDRRERYGLGWRLGIGGKGSSEQTFGHGGATGTLAWMDPERDLCFVLLTTWPSAQSQSPLITPVSDLASAAFR